MFKEKIAQAVEILKEKNVDMWLTFVRESEVLRDPCLDLILGANCTWQSAFVITRTGKTARSLSKYRIKTPILAFVDHVETIKLLTPVWGVKGELIDNMSDTDTTLKRAKELALQLNYLKKGDSVVFVTGIPLLESKRVNMMKVDTI